MARFMVVSDTHNFEKDSAPPSSPMCQKLPKVDVLLHCGDITQVGGKSAYKKALRMLEDFDAELKLVIAGNHDLSLDGEYWRTHLEDDDEPEEHDEAVAIMTGPLAKKANVKYLNEGLHKFTLRNGVGFSIFVSPYQPESGDWAFGYKRGADRWHIPDDVDIVMTHGPPHGILDSNGEDQLGCESLLEAVERSRPLVHCFGHIHEGYGAETKAWISGDVDVSSTAARSITVSKAGVAEEAIQDFSIVRGKSTLMVNAAIIDDHNNPANAPWVIDLPLHVLEDKRTF